MVKTIQTSITCPYCGNTEIYNIEPQSYIETDRFICDPDEDGCDRYFFVELETNIKVRTYKRVE